MAYSPPSTSNWSIAKHFIYIQHHSFLETGKLVTKRVFCCTLYLSLVYFQKTLSKMLPIGMLLPGCLRPESFALIQIGGKTPFSLTNQEIRCSIFKLIPHKQLMQYHSNVSDDPCFAQLSHFPISIFLDRKWIKWKIHSLKVGLQATNVYCSERNKNKLNVIYMYHRCIFNVQYLIGLIFIFCN